MFPQTISDIARLLKANITITNDYTIVTVCIDSRYVSASNNILFVALDGKRIDKVLAFTIPVTVVPT